MSAQKPKKKIFSGSNIFTAIIIAFAIAMLFSADFKATVIQGLMKVGLFQPDISAKIKDQPKQKTQSWPVQFINSKGETLDGDMLQGKVVFINTWATWCPPCIAEMPSINDLYKKYKTNTDVVFLLVDADGDFAKSEAFMKTKNFELPVYISQGVLPNEWFDSSLPATVVLDKDGKIAYKHTGAANYNNEKFKNFIDGLLH